MPQIIYREIYCSASEASDEDFFVEYERRGVPHRFALRGGEVQPGGDAGLRRHLPTAARKWML